MNIKTEPESTPDSLELCVQKICWNCNYCNKVYASKSYRDSHISKMHIAVKCAICGVVFPSINLFRKHHNGEHSKHVKQSHDRDDVIGQKSSKEHSKITRNEPRKLNKTAALSMRMTESDKKGELFWNVSLFFSISQFTPNNCMIENFVSLKTKDSWKMQNDNMKLIQQKVTKVERMIANLQKNFKTLNSKLEVFPSALNIFQNVCIWKLMVTYSHINSNIWRFFLKLFSASKGVVLHSSVVFRIEFF